MNMIVVYDIACPRRIVRVAKILKDYGVRVQKSIFEVDVDAQFFREMRCRVEKKIVPEEDGIKYFPFCEKCAGAVEIIGQGSLTDPDEEYYVI
jgi:CRISPR-associated protein Cas2